MQENLAELEPPKGAEGPSRCRETPFSSSAKKSFSVGTVSLVAQKGKAVEGALGPYLPFSSGEDLVLDKAYFLAAKSRGLQGLGDCLGRRAVVLAGLGSEKAFAPLLDRKPVLP